MRGVFIHAGAHRTGTSSFQLCLAQNRAARLLAAGRGVQTNLVEAMKWHLLARNAGIQDAWLDGRLTQLSASQRATVEDAVKKFNGG